jgi:hypothetical protein
MWIYNLFLIVKTFLLKMLSNVFLHVWLQPAVRDISAQEAVHLLLADKLVGCTRTFCELEC